MAVEAMGMQIRIPQGDTGSVKFTYDKGEVAAEDRALFTVANANGGAILRKVLAPNNSDLAFHLPFTYEETAVMRPGRYDWSLRVIRDGTLDASGKITAVKGSHTAILRGKLTILPVAGGAS